MIFQDLINNEHDSITMIANIFFIKKISHRYRAKVLRDHETSACVIPRRGIWETARDVVRSGCVACDAERRLWGAGRDPAYIGCGAGLEVR